MSRLPHTLPPVLGAVTPRAVKAHQFLERLDLCLAEQNAQQGFGMRLQTYSIGFIAPGDPSTAVCMAYDMKLRLEGISERIQKAKCVSANEDVTFTRLEKGPHHDGVRFANGAEETLQELGPGVKGYLYNALSSPIWMPETAQAT